MPKSANDAANFEMFVSEGGSTSATSGADVSLDSTHTETIGSVSGVGTTTAKIEYDGSNRMLSEVLLNPLRPELLAVMDLTSVIDPHSDWPGEKNSFYEYVNSKLSLRTMDSATVASILAGVQANSPDEFSEAIKQYETSVASASSEIELLKLAYMLKNYMVLGINFRDFLEVFDHDSSTTPGVNLGITGTWGESQSSNYTMWMKTVLGFNTDSVATNSQSSGILFVNALQQLSFMTAIGSPATVFKYQNPLLNGGHNLAASKNYAGVNSWLAELDTLGYEARSGYNLANIGIHHIHGTAGDGGNFSFLKADKTSRMTSSNFGNNFASTDISAHMPCTQIISSVIANNLNTSYTVKQCNLTAGAYDTILWDILQKRAGSAISMSPLASDNSIFLSLVGWDPYLRTRKDGSKLKDDCLISSQFFPDLTMFKSGVMGDAFDEEMCYVEKHDVSYTSTSSDTVNISGIKKTINEAFGSVSGMLSFNDYENIVENLQTSTSDLGIALGKMHRAGKYQNLSSAERRLSNNTTTGVFANFPQTAFDPGSVLDACMDTFSERFAKNFEKTYLWHGFQQSNSTSQAPQSWAAVETDEIIQNYLQPDVSNIKKFASLQAYGMINSDNDNNNNNGRGNGLAIAKQVVSSFIKDYHAGYLTFDIEEEEVIDFAADSDGNFVETSFWVKKNKSPLNGSPLSLRGTKSALWSTLMPAGDGEVVSSTKGHSIYYEVADLNTLVKNHCITNDLLELYATPVVATSVGSTDMASSDADLLYTNVFDITEPLAGWLQWAPIYTPGNNSSTNNPKLFTKSILNLDIGGTGDGDSTPLKEYLDAMQSTVQTMKQIGLINLPTGIDSVSSPKGTPYEACNMWKYSWHFARDTHKETEERFIPLLANLWASEMIEMCMKTMQQLLKNRGILVGATSSSDLSFPQYAYSAPYCDDSGFVGILSDGIEHNGGVDVNEFPFEYCFLNMAAFDTDNPTGINFSKWVPTMNAIQENFCRSDGTLMSGQSLDTIFGHIIDNMALLMKQTYPFFHIAYIQQDNSGKNTRWPILGTYGAMVEQETLLARSETSSGDEKPAYKRRGPPILPHVLFPYFYQSGVSQPGNKPPPPLSRALQNIIDIHEIENSKSEDQGGSSYYPSDITVNPQANFTFVERYNSGVDATTNSTYVGTLMDTYPDQWLTQVEALQTWYMTVNADNYISSDSANSNFKDALNKLIVDNRPEITDNVRASPIYLSMWAALSGNPALFGYGHDSLVDNISESGSESGDGTEEAVSVTYTGRGIRISLGYYDSGDEHRNPEGAGACAPKDFWASWWISAVPTLLSAMKNIPVTATNHGHSGWSYGSPSSDSVSTECVFGAIFQSEHTMEGSGASDIYSSVGDTFRFGQSGDLIGCAPGKNYAPEGSFWKSPGPHGMNPNLLGRLGSSAATKNARFNGSNDTSMSQMYWIAQQLEPIYEGLILSCKEPHFKAVAFNIFEKFGARIKEYCGTAIDAFNGDGGSKNLEPVIDYIQDLARSGDPGQDILQNLTEQQMALKYVSLFRQKGDPENGLLPSQDVIGSKILEAITLMFQGNGGGYNRPGPNSVLVSSMGKRDLAIAGQKTMVFGIPAGGVEEFDASANAANSVSNTVEGQAILGNNVAIGERYREQGMWAAIFAYNFEFPQVILEPMMIPIIPNLFVVKESFDNVVMDDVVDLEDLRDKIKFLKVELSVQEGTGEDNQIVVNDDVSLDTLNNLYGDTLDDKKKGAAIYILESYLLENYYKITTGITINEDTFPSTSDDIGLGINDYASNLTEALASEFSSYNSTVSSAVSQVMDSLVSSVQSYNSVASEFTTALGSTEYSDLSDEILDSATNAAGSRIYSAEKMKEMVVKAKRFDRVFYVRVHPDSFPVRWINAGGQIMGMNWSHKPTSYLNISDYEASMGDGTAGTQQLIGATSYSDVLALSGGTASDPIDDESQWILIQGYEGGIDTLSENRYMIPLMDISDMEFTAWNTIRSTQLRFRNRSGEQSINFFRASVVLIDESGLKGMS